jgi:hypothetical protein
MIISVSKIVEKLVTALISLLSMLNLVVMANIKLAKLQFRFMSNVEAIENAHRSV